MTSNDDSLHIGGGVCALDVTQLIADVIDAWAPRLSRDIGDSRQDNAILDAGAAAVCVCLIMSLGELLQGRELVRLKKKKAIGEVLCPIVVS